MQCTICSGPLELRLPGASEAPSPAALSPSRHEPGAHGDLFACTECGTVQQPSLPRGPRRRGYDVFGLELSATAAAHARDVLGLPVREMPLEDLVAEEFDVIVLADVLEHLDDPLAALDGCRDLLAPDGVLCVATPDPSSLVARLAGRRWWGFLPGHAHLLPRRTLREVMAGRGLVVSTDVSLVRSFSARRWIEGLGERAGALRAPLARLAGALPARAMLSLSLGDERVMLAHR